MVFAFIGTLFAFLYSAYWLLKFCRFQRDMAQNFKQMRVDLAEISHVDLASSDRTLK